MEKISQRTALKIPLKVLFVCLAFTLVAGKTFAATYDWVGTGTGSMANRVKWSIASNWKIAGVTATTVPGNSAADIVRIGVTAYTTSSPTLDNVSETIAQVEFGNNAGNAMSLTINPGLKLIVTAAGNTGLIKVDHSNSTSDVTVNLAGSTGEIDCDAFTLGNGVLPSGGTNTTTVNSSVGTLSITNTLTLASASNAGGTTINNTIFNVNTCDITFANIVFTEANPNASIAGSFLVSSTFTNSVTLTGVSAITFAAHSLIDFISGAGSGANTNIIYNSSNLVTPQVIYTTADDLASTSFGFGLNPAMYPNLTIMGAGAKTVHGTLLSVDNDFTTSGGTIDLSTNDPVVTVGGDWDNTATVNEGSGAISAVNLINHSGGGVINGNSAAASSIFTGGLTNTGTINTNAESFSFATLVTTSGTYDMTGGAGTSTFTGGLTNTGTFKSGSTTITIPTGKTITNNSPGVITESTGAISTPALINPLGATINGSATTGTFSVTTSAVTNAGTINVFGSAFNFTALLTNTGTYDATGGNGVSTFTLGLTNTGTFKGGSAATTIPAGKTVTNSSPGVFTGGTGTITIPILVNAVGATINGSATTGIIAVTSPFTNAGTINVVGGTFNFAGLITNTGTYDGTTGNGVSNFNAGLTNSNAVKAGTGTITITTFTNSSPGVFTGSASTGATNVTTLANATGATITVAKENITYSGAVTNAGLYTGGTGTTTTGLSIFNGTFTNNTGGTFNAGTSDITFDNSYTNTGTGVFSAAAGTVIFAGASAQALLDNSTSANGTAFNSVKFSGNNTKTMTGSKGFSVAGTGILTLVGTSTSLATGGVLTLKSILNTSAIVDVIPAGCTITGNVSVERFIRGSNINKRGYRLMTSTVYTGTDPTAGNVFDLQYLTTYVFVSGSGGAANGFNVPTTNNPSLYLFREDETPPPTSTTKFTTGYNWKGVAKLTGMTPAYATGTQAKGTVTNVFNSTVLLPVANGYLFYFRGDKSTTANYTGPSFGIPQDVTLKQTGTLNTGTIPVKLWYNYTVGAGNLFSYTSANVNPLTTVSGGYALIGNPYPSTINWEKYNNTNAPGAITQTGGLSGIIYFYNPTNKQYEPYTPLTTNTNLTTEYTAGVTGGGTAIGKASNFITSGQAFFIVASNNTQTLTFGEQAKVLAQPANATTQALMGKPKEFVAAPVPLLRLKMIKDTDNYDEVAIRLDNKTNAKYVEGEDALDLDGDGALETLSTFSSDNIRLSIDFRPFPGKQDVVIPLKTGSPVSGAFQLNMSELAGLPSLYTVWLKDAFTSDSLQMKAGTSYSFNIDKTDSTTFGANRFRLIIRQDTANAYKLLDFTANRIDNSSNVEVDWKTKNEQNYLNFTVERSNDGGNSFNVAGGKASTGAGAYSLVDKNAQRGENIYRLKQEDMTNTISYSDLVKVFIGNNDDNKIHIYPNPAVNFINLDFSAKVKRNGGAYEILVTNSSGTVVRFGSSTDAYWQTGISNLHPGTYLVHVINRKDKKLIGQAKFIKL